MSPFSIPTHMHIPSGGCSAVCVCNRATLTLFIVILRIRLIIRDTLPHSSHRHSAHPSSAQDYCALYFSCVRSPFLLLCSYLCRSHNMPATAYQWVISIIAKYGRALPKIRESSEFGERRRDFSVSTNAENSIYRIRRTIHPHYALLTCGVYRRASFSHIPRHVSGVRTGGKG